MIPNSPLSRRQWLLGSFAAGLGVPTLAPAAQSVSNSPPSRLGLPGFFPGRVVAVSHPGCFVNGKFQAAPIAQVVREGMLRLTGAPDITAAWRRFFGPGEVVGIKVNPVGAPLVMSSPEMLHAIVHGLESAGVRRRDIVVYDRYRDQFLQAGMDRWLPDGVRWSCAVEKYDPVQQDLGGYDPEHYMEMAVTLPGADAASETARRSYAARFITREVDKLINLPVLKHHQSAGVTLALKNLSHGLVNNVARSHPTRTLNVCGAFIPAVVALPVIRHKTVLHLLDGIRGVYHGGPFARAPYVWEHRTVYFATDPVAMDRIGWDAIERQRKAAGMKPIAEALPDKVSTFVHGQTEHIELAGALGLGVFDRRKIDLRRVALT